MKKDAKLNNYLLAKHITKMVLLDLDDRFGCPDWIHPTRGGDAAKVRRAIQSTIEHALETFR